MKSLLIRLYRYLTTPAAIRRARANNDQLSHSVALHWEQFRR